MEISCFVVQYKLTSFTFFHALKYICKTKNYLQLTVHLKIFPIFTHIWLKF